MKRATLDYIDEELIDAIMERHLYEGRECSRENLHDYFVRKKMQRDHWMSFDERTRQIYNTFFDTVAVREPDWWLTKPSHEVHRYLTDPIEYFEDIAKNKQSRYLDYLFKTM